jgi:hypothetical protein
MEIDFAVVYQESIERVIEVKLADGTLSRSLVQFHQKHQCPAIQLVRFLRQEQQQEGIQILRAETFLSGLSL